MFDIYKLNITKVCTLFFFFSINTLDPSGIQQRHGNVGSWSFLNVLLEREKFEDRN